MSNIRTVVKSTLGQERIAKIRSPLEKLRLGWLSVARRSRWLTKCHYFFFSSAFDNEMRATVNGHILHHNNKTGKDLAPNYFLRRAIHRIEKGLTHRNPRSKFGVDYILPTVDAYVATRQVRREGADISWASSVLDEYFKIADHSVPAIAAASQRYHEVERLEQPAALAPFRSKDPAGESEVVGFEGLHRLAIRRSSVRWFLKKSVPTSLIDEAVQVARQSPSACNRQPVRMIIFRDAAVHDVAKLAMGAASFAENIPGLAVIVGQQRAYPHPRDRHVIYIDGGLAAMSFMFGLEALGLSSCPINWPDVARRDAAIARRLKLDDDERVIMLIAFGFADAAVKIPSSSKVSLDTFRQYQD